MLNVVPFLGVAFKLGWQSVWVHAGLGTPVLGSVRGTVLSACELEYPRIVSKVVGIFVVRPEHRVTAR